MTPEHTDMAGAARLREALAKLSDCGDWYVRCLQDVRRRVPVRNLDEAEAGYIAALDGAREALAAVPEAPEPVYEWEYKTADWLAPNLIATHRRKVGPWERVEEGTER